MESTPIDLDYMLNKAKLNEDKNQLYTKIIQFERQLGINYQLMSLKDPNIDDEDKRIVDDAVENAPPSLNIGNFVEMTEDDQLNERVKLARMVDREFFFVRLEANKSYK